MERLIVGKDNFVLPVIYTGTVHSIIPIFQQSNIPLLYQTKRPPMFTISNGFSFSFPDIEEGGRFGYYISCQISTRGGGRTRTGAMPTGF